VPDEELPYLYNGHACLRIPHCTKVSGCRFWKPWRAARRCDLECLLDAEIVGEAGLLVDPHDRRQLTEAIERLIVDDDLHHALQEQGVRRAADFSWEKTARETSRRTPLRARGGCESACIR